MTRYKTIKVAGKTKQLHRHLMEQHIGRPLRADEHVHHKDGNRYNNALDNLELKAGLKHIQDHADLRAVHPKTKQCKVCGTAFTPHPTKRKRAKTCSKVCADALRSATEKATKAAIIRANAPDLVVRFGDERKAVAA